MGWDRQSDWPWDPEPSSGATIDVIEPTSPRDISDGARIVPFGFSRALLEPSPEERLAESLTTQLDHNERARKEAEDRLRWIGVLEAQAALGTDLDGL